MKTLQKKIYYLILSALIMATLASAINILKPAEAFAQTSSSIFVQPSKQNISINPGDKILKSLLLVNSTQNPITLKVSVKDFKVVDGNGKIEFYIADGSKSASKWLIPQYNIVSIPAFNSSKMEYLVSIDKNMAGGGYSGAIVFQLYDSNKNITYGNVFGTLVSLNVLGKGITTGGTINGFSMPAIQFNDPARFGFKVSNPSNSNLSASGTITLSNIFGKKITQFNTDQLDVYPGSTKSFNFAWNNSPLFGLYKGQVNITNSLRQDYKMTSSTWFLFLPWQKTLPYVLAVILIAVLGIVSYKYRYKILKYAKEKLALAKQTAKNPRFQYDEIFKKIKIPKKPRLN